jgi:hypothetical protein
MVRLASLPAILGACIALAAGCGEERDDEVTLGEETVPSQVERNRERIRALERKLAARRKARAKATAGPPAAPIEGSGGLLDGDDATSFAALEQTLGAEVGVAVGPVGATDSQRLGALTGGAAWSTIKVPIAVRTIEDAGGPQALSAAARDQIARAITASDNAAAASLWEQLSAGHGGAVGAAAAVRTVLGQAGDAETTVSTVGRDGFSPYGQTQWSLAAQHRFASRFAAGCVSPEALEHLRPLMAEVVPDQRWGLGSAGVDAWFKGGWGPEPDGRYLVRQLGVLDLGGPAVAVALAAKPADGQLATGTAALTALAQWVVESVDPAQATVQPC